MSPAPHPRIAWIDAARSLALCGMVLFHLVLDLQMFGMVPPGTVAMPGPWALFARLVAGSFIFLAGVSLGLAHGQGIRWPAFLRRLAILLAAAAAVTIGTYAFMPSRFVFFGILHAIAAFSVLGLAFLRMPPLPVLVTAMTVLCLPFLWTSPAFDTPWLVWTGLAPTLPQTLDFEPLFPWFAPFLAGIAAARALQDLPGPDWLHRPPGPVLRRLAWPGRHSLAIYLVHQPVLVALVWGLARMGG